MAKATAWRADIPPLRTRVIMNIGIIGSGGIGGTIGSHWAKAGHSVLFSSRNPEKLAPLVASAGPNAKAGTIAEAARFGEVILYAGYYWTIDEALAAAGDLSGKILVDASNPYVFDNGAIKRVPGASAGRELAARPTANTQFPRALWSGCERHMPAAQGWRRSAPARSCWLRQDC
jgi:predicted dinucleotide-binding enzyme